MDCPVDGNTLVMADRQGIEIDYCPRCRGVWLDRGELDKIVERSERYDADDEPARAVDTRRSDERRYDRDDDDDRRRDHDREYRGPYGKKKKKSFFGEMFEGFGGD